MQQQGHLIVGDRLYQGEQSTILGKGMMLCAAGLSMQHPITNEHLEVSIDPPAKFHRLLDREEQRFQSQ
jgi:23S rRNA-/tRNA-specific pseudouridylate synthase